VKGMGVKLMNQKISENKTRKKYKNKKFFESFPTLDKNNNECVVFHNDNGYIISDFVLNLGNME
jgi:hypothetical protein